MIYQSPEKAAHVSSKTPPEGNRAQLRAWELRVWPLSVEDLDIIDGSQETCISLTLMNVKSAPNYMLRLLWHRNPRHIVKKAKPSTSQSVHHNM